jgi:plastocyanin
VRTAIFLPALLLASIACSDDDDNGLTDDGGTPSGDIIVSNNSFDPATFTTGVGEEVVWAWAEGAVTHNVTFQDGPASPDQSSGTYARTFTAPGQFPYLCTIHPRSMNGVVTVGSASGGTGSGDGGGGGGGYDYVERAP